MRKALLAELTKAAKEGHGYMVDEGEAAEILAELASTRRDRDEWKRLANNAADAFDLVTRK